MKSNIKKLNKKTELTLISKKCQELIVCSYKIQKTIMLKSNINV